MADGYVHVILPLESDAKYRGHIWTGQHGIFPIVSPWRQRAFDAARVSGAQLGQSLEEFVHAGRIISYSSELL